MIRGAREKILQGMGCSAILCGKDSEKILGEKNSEEWKFKTILAGKEIANCGRRGVAKRMWGRGVGVGV
jgi:hypothetical protein